MMQSHVNLKQKTLEMTMNHFLEEHRLVAKIQDKNKLLDLIAKTIKFNKNLIWHNDEENVFLATTVEAVLEIYMLRSKVYGKMGYDDEFPDTIKGLNFDKYDSDSAILYTRAKGIITGTCRIIFDSSKKLPMDKNYTLEHMRAKDNKIAELSRLMIDDSHTKGLSQVPKWLTKGVYHIMKDNGMSILMSVMIHTHFRLYSKFGGFKIEDELESYGRLDTPFIITSWEIEKISPYFKRAFLAA